VIIMSGPDWRRLWMHVPGGLFGAFLMWFHWQSGLVFNSMFIVYELAQCWRIGDKGFKDILGHVVGFGIGIAVWAILSLTGVI